MQLRLEQRARGEHERVIARTARELYGRRQTVLRPTTRQRERGPAQG
ncbi:hypothetical protein BH18ACT13_BH18ACT13_21140 [soil metagenome]